MNCETITDWCHTPAYDNGGHCHAPIINGVPLCNHTTQSEV